MCKRAIVWGVIAALALGIAWIGVAGKSLIDDEADLMEAIESTVDGSIDLIEDALTKKEMRAIAKANDVTVDQLVSSYEETYGSVSFDLGYIRVYIELLGTWVWIDPIHVCGQGTGRALSL